MQPAAAKDIRVLSGERKSCVSYGPDMPVAMRSASSVNPSTTAAAPKARDATYVDYKIRGSAIHLCPLSLSLFLSLSVLLVSPAALAASHHGAAKRCGLHP